MYWTLLGRVQKEVYEGMVVICRKERGNEDPSTYPEGKSSKVEKRSRDFTDITLAKLLASAWM